MRATGAILCGPSCIAGFDWVGVLEVAGLGLEFLDCEPPEVLVRSGVERVILLPGDLALLALSIIQCLH